MKFLDSTVLSKFGPPKDKNFSNLYKYLVSYCMLFYEMYSQCERGVLIKFQDKKLVFAVVDNPRKLG